ncbi:recombination-associated protein RdgC [Vreelandella rituensis]|uniref:Recombination-associated protein RdgC n=1 Tax=Vreelandella rituensis TaxID=2282306 RepID=A0A368U8Y0_9GAMM|nr:recombination-associated protein RdgC [Halomonas rituensis]RCV93649.1 recombination-associated protein RdgC [Halomonas rituensis]
MFFKNALLYRLRNKPAIALDALENALGEHRAVPLGESQARRHAWTAPAGRASNMLVHEVQGQRLLSVLSQERMLPASVVKEEVEDAVAEIESKEGRKVTRKEKTAIKEQITEALMPRAFIRSKRTFLWWDTRNDLICVDASSRTTAEDALDLLRETLGSLKVVPLRTQELPVGKMTAWLTDPATRPAWLVMGDKATLKDKADTVFTARCADLDGEEIQTMLANGCQASQLAISIEKQASCVLTDDLALKGIRFAEALIEEADHTEDGDDALVRLETDFHLMTGALTQTIDMLIDCLGGEVAFEPESEPEPASDAA